LEQLCIEHPAVPQFTFELDDDVVRCVCWRAANATKAAGTGTAGMANRRTALRPTSKPEILDDPRIEPAIQWLRRLDWFTPEPGLWHGDANENSLNILAAAWPDRPEGIEYLGNTAFIGSS